MLRVYIFFESGGLVVLETNTAGTCDLPPRLAVEDQNGSSSCSSGGWAMAVWRIGWDLSPVVGD